MSYSEFPSGRLHCIEGKRNYVSKWQTIQQPATKAVAKSMGLTHHVDSKGKGYVNIKVPLEYRERCLSDIELERKNLNNLKGLKKECPDMVPYTRVEDPLLKADLIRSPERRKEAGARIVSCGPYMTEVILDPIKKSRHDLSVLKKEKKAEKELERVLSGKAPIIKLKSKSKSRSKSGSRRRRSR